MDVTKETKPIDSIPMDERKSFLIKIIMVIRQNFREYFGDEFAHKCGHFIDKDICKEIRNYGYWVTYLDGNHVLKGKTSALTAAISSDGCYLFVGYKDKCIIKWNMLSLEQMDEWTAHDDEVSRLIFRRDLLISGSIDQKIKVWNGYSNQLIQTLEGHTGRIRGIDLNRDGSQIISSSSDNSMRLWSVKTGECLKEINIHSNDVRSVVFVNELIMSGSYDRSIKISNPSDGTEIKSITEGITNAVFAVCMNSDQSMVACLFMNGLTIYTWPDMKMIRSIVENPLSGDFHPINPDVLAVSNCLSHHIMIYNVKTGDLIGVSEGHNGFVRGICYSPDGTRIVSASLDNCARVWDV